VSGVAISSPTAPVEDRAGGVAAFYDARVGGKLADFVNANPRIEAAVETLAEWAPTSPRRVLEIGCGVGATTWRMARAWPGAEVIGVDISAASIRAAQACFQRPNLAYRTGALADCALDGVFDLVLMMDVYEHIAPADRPALHAALETLLSPESRLLLMVPSPAHQTLLRDHKPEGLQPIDESIDVAQLLALASETGTRLLSCRDVGVWHYGDYVHAVLGRGETLQPVALRQTRGGPMQRLKALLGRPQPSDGLRDHLGFDVLGPRRAAARRFRVSHGERRRIAAALAAPPR
jgi:2-polyprenyl-3-methyl-5-hydroxy-6-metoxy-1,4-benzoquinol methylase